MRNVRWLLCLIVTISPYLSHAGTLSDFERDATEEKEDRQESGSSGKSKDRDKRSWLWRRDNDEGDGSGSMLLGLVVGTFGAVGAGGAYSWERVRPEDALEEVQPRQSGEALIPFVRVDAAYQNIESDVDARDLRVEAGYGPIAVHVNQTWFEEDDPDADLDVTRILGLYRMSLGNHAELDLGGGAIKIEGEDEENGGSFTSSILVHPWEWLGVEFRPTWSWVNDNSIRDYDLAVLIGWRYVSLKAGYRWFQAEDESLNGPLVGLSVRF